MEFFKYFFFTVTGDKAYKAETWFHTNFFETNGAFFFGLLWAFIIGVALAAIFYLVCCNNKESNALAKIHVWAIFLILAGALTFFVADWGIIGQRGAKVGSSFYEHSFYKANEKLFTELTNPSKHAEIAKNPTVVQQLASTKQNIKQDLDHGKDVRNIFNITCVVWSIIFFYLASITIKGYTRFGIPVPHKWPSK